MPWEIAGAKKEGCIFAKAGISRGINDQIAKDTVKLLSLYWNTFNKCSPGK